VRSRRPREIFGSVSHSEAEANGAVNAGKCPGKFTASISCRMRDTTLANNASLLIRFASANEPTWTSETRNSYRTRKVRQGRLERSLCLCRPRSRLLDPCVERDSIPGAKNLLLPRQARLEHKGGFAPRQSFRQVFLVSFGCVSRKFHSAGNSAAKRRAKRRTIPSAVQKARRRTGPAGPEEIKKRSVCVLDDRWRIFFATFPRARADIQRVSRRVVRRL
jgi:hypothetical protein